MKVFLGFFGVYALCVVVHGYVRLYHLIFSGYSHTKKKTNTSRQTHAYRHNNNNKFEMNFGQKEERKGERVSCVLKVHSFFWYIVCHTWVHVQNECTKHIVNAYLRFELHLNDYVSVSLSPCLLLV